MENLILSMAADDMGSREAAEAYWEASQRLAEAAEGELAKGRRARRYGAPLPWP